MEQYINKSDLVAELEKRKKELETNILLAQERKDADASKTMHLYIGCYNSILSFLDTLKTKEVDSIENNEEDESIRKEIIALIKSQKEQQCHVDGAVYDKMIDWLEKLEDYEHIKKDWLEHIKQSWYKEGFIDGKYSSGEQGEQNVTNEEIEAASIIHSEIVRNQSCIDEDFIAGAQWLKRQNHICNKDDEEKPADKVEPKFKVGDWIVNRLGNIWHIDSFDAKNYQVTTTKGEHNYFPINIQDRMHLWTIADAKPGDVLATEPIDAYPSPFVAIYKIRRPDYFNSYCLIRFDGKFYEADTGHSIENIYPATKEQRDLLFEKMHEARYEWDAEKKELRKIDNEEVNGEDYGIDGLWHAQRILEKTLGSVDGYQTDDGILAHKAAITAVKKLYYEQKLAWNEEDEKFINDINSL